MALSMLGNLASKILPTVIGWGAQKLGGDRSVGGKLIKSIGDVAG